MLSAHIRFYLFLSVYIILSSCQSSTETLPVELENQRSAEAVLSYYFGSYTAHQGITPQEAEILKIEKNRVHINLNTLNGLGLSQPLGDTNKDGVIDWEELEPFLVSTYYEARNFPATLDALYHRMGIPEANSEWMLVELDGSMVSARREIYVKQEAIRSALLDYKSNNNQILYPVGTTFIAHHKDKDQIIETTVSQKRNDNAWDFFVYDQDGRLTSSTQTGPKELTAPTRCTGCHFGTKLFEPEVSYPDQAPDGPFGARGIYVEESLRSQRITSTLDEHAKRSDTVLGLYGTLYASGLLAKLEKGELLSDQEQAILDQIGIAVTSD